MSTPNCDYEFHTLHVDSIYAESPVSSLGATANNFVVHLPKMMENVAEVELISASIGNPLSSNVAYIVIDELQSDFNSKTGNTEGNTISTSAASRSIAKYQIDPAVTTRQNFNFNDCPVTTQYINPIQRLDRLTVKILDEKGISPMPMADPFFCSIKFSCIKPNLCTRL